MEEVGSKVGKKRKKYEEILEWGDTYNSINQMAQIKQVDKISLVKTGNDGFKKLVKKLRAQKKFQVDVIKIPEEKEEK